MQLPDGLYDLVLSQALAKILADATTSSTCTLDPISDADSHERLAEAFTIQLTKALDEVQGDGTERTRNQLQLVNEILVLLRKRNQAEDQIIDALHDPPRLLRSIHRKSPPNVSPETGLNAPWLFTAGKGSPSLLAELRRELTACDQVDVLMSFVTVSGVRKLADVLQSLTAIGADGQPKARLRLLTTTYTGATEIQALDTLSRLPGCEIKVSLDGRRTRLHAKAWIFHRATGFGSAYVGSANLSGAALAGGLEWTVKFTERRENALFQRAKAHFETLWNDTEFQTYRATDPAHRAALHDALRRESGQELIASPGFFDIQPKSYQQEMLDELSLERQHGRYRNLVVAATGTGKTVVAAFDYRRTCQLSGGRPRLLFVAHREEILRQALRTYREVLRDHSFGELLMHGQKLTSFDHVFGVINSVNGAELPRRCGPDYWHTVVVDECHRLAADSFQEFVTAVRPQILLGLTATPERSDGKPILPYFENRPDGSPAVELRLWHALDLQLLSPFEYYGCDDDTDFTDVPWNQPGELAAVERIVTGNDIRARLIIDEWRRLTVDPEKCRALVFCATVPHAEFMARKFNEAGLPALCVSGRTSQEQRRKAPEQLARGELCALVTCDLYNEGVDLPAVDTLLLLRPTESPVLFQQQIGRGLRLAPGKESCVVLDFVGRHRTDFRFDRLLSSLTGLTRGELIHAVDQGFSQLPPGCHIHLGRVTREQVLHSLRALIHQTWRRLCAELQAYMAIRGRNNIRLPDFLRGQAITADELYRGAGRCGWTNLKRDVGLVATASGAEDDYFGRRFSDLLHIDDPEQIDLLSRLAETTLSYNQLNAREQLRLQMLAYQVDGQQQQIGSANDFLRRLSTNLDIRGELGELGLVLQSRGAAPFQPIPGLEDAPLCLHASYGVREILTAVGTFTAERRPAFREGVLPLHNKKVELLFVTLDKTEGFHDRIAYHDYAISPERFHWQTQNAAGPGTTAGKRYLESPGNGWRFQLFVRRLKGEAYRACGPVELVESSGDRPMSIVWRLQVPLPTRLFQEFSVLRGA